MFSRWLNLTHRVRLTALLTIVVSVAMALIFASLLGFLRMQALNRRYSFLERNTDRIAHEWRGPASLAEEHDDFPEMDFAVYSSDHVLIASTSKKPPPFVQGNWKSKGVLAVGRNVDGLTFVGSASWKETETGLRQLALVLAGLWLPLTLLTAGLAWYGGGLVLRPVTELVASAEKLSERSVDQLLTTTDTAEFASLAASLNQLIERVRRSATLQEQFASDAAHELRNPLALLRTRVETALLRERSVPEYIAALRSQLSEIERLTALVEMLLLTARQERREVAPIEFDVEVAAVAHRWAESRDWPQDRLTLKLSPSSAAISSEELEIVLRNLLENAAHHAPEGTPILIEVATIEGKVSTTVVDQGPGIDPSEAKVAFERFYRSDAGRNRKHGGAGIGLSVVKRIIESYGGNVEFLAVQSGAQIRFVLPAD